MPIAGAPSRVVYRRAKPLESATSANRRIIEGLSESVAVEQDLTLGALVRPSDASEPIQRWFRYREGYTAELCRRLLTPNESLVLDPFCGFGSTLLAARNAGIQSVGIDSNPLAAFVTQVKTRTYSATARSTAAATFKRWQRVRRNGKQAPPPQLRILPKLFHPEILAALLVYRAWIDELQHDYVRDLFKLAWLSTLEDVSNVFREGNGIKYRNRVRRGNVYSITPYDEWEKKRFPVDKFAFVQAALASKLEQILGELPLLGSGAQPRVHHDDAARAATHVEEGSASTILFSPPYCNCFNYIKAYKLELWLGGFIREYHDIPVLNSKALSSRTETLKPLQNHRYPSAVSEIVSLMPEDGLWNDQLPNVIRGYFEDMQNILSTLRPLMKDDGQCLIVVGNSAYAGVLVPSDLLLAEAARSVGYGVDKIVVTRHLTTSSQQRVNLAPLREYMRESIISLRKRP